MANPNTEWMEAYYRVTLLEFTVDALEKEVEGLKERKASEGVQGGFNHPSTPPASAQKQHNNKKQPVSANDGKVKDRGSTLEQRGSVSSSNTATTTTPFENTTRVIAVTQRVLKPGACILFQDGTCKWNVHTCNRAHACMLCGGPHPLLHECHHLKACFWRKEYCLLFQRNKFLCHRQSCLKIHKCLKCDSEDHGAEYCILG